VIESDELDIGNKKFANKRMARKRIGARLIEKLQTEALGSGLGESGP